jgi:hypothetical protein
MCRRTDSSFLFSREAHFPTFDTFGCKAHAMRKKHIWSSWNPAEFLSTDDQLGESHDKALEADRNYGATKYRLCAYQLAFSPAWR